MDHTKLKRDLDNACKNDPLTRSIKAKKAKKGIKIRMVPGYVRSKDEDPIERRRKILKYNHQHVSKKLRGLYSDLQGTLRHQDHAAPKLSQKIFKAEKEAAKWKKSILNFEKSITRSEVGQEVAMISARMWLAAGSENRAVKCVEQQYDFFTHPNNWNLLGKREDFVSSVMEKARAQTPSGSKKRKISTK